MFAPGEKEVVRLTSEADREERSHLAFICSAFSDDALEASLLKALPDAEDVPPQMLPPGWEQRCDEASGRIFFVDHLTCSTSWQDPRVGGAKDGGSEAEAEGEENDDAADAEDAGQAEQAGQAEGSAADLAALSTGVLLPKREEQLAAWSRAVERTARAAVNKATRSRRNAADVAQSPRFMLVQASPLTGRATALRPDMSAAWPLC